jgi:diaminopimelate epimerase
MSPPLRFTKMHGIGNDYIYLDGFADARVREMGTDALRHLAIEMSDRHRGIGSDGLILTLPPENAVAADVRMRMFNADGSESEMCGNGIRCVAKYAHDHGLTPARPLRVQTGAGILSIDYTLDENGRVHTATVDMGAPIVELCDVPVNPAELSWSRPPYHAIETGPERTDVWIGTFVSMGNPHAVFFDAENSQIAGIDLSSVELDRLGPKIEHHAAFPRRINVHLVQVIARNEIRMRTWERGAGLTMACGTGACAVCVAGVLTDLTDRAILAHLPGGDLQLRWDEKTDQVFMTGPAAEVFSGEWFCGTLS